MNPLPCSIPDALVAASKSPYHFCCVFMGTVVIEKQCGDCQQDLLEECFVQPIVHSDAVSPHAGVRFLPV